MGKTKEVSCCEVDKVTGRVLETPAIRESGLAAIRVLMDAALADGKVKKFVRTDDQFLLPFLRARKYKIESSYKVVLNFNTFWYKHAHLLDGLNAQRCRRFVDAHMIKFLNGADVHGNSVYALFMGAMDPEKFNAEDQVLYSVYSLALLFERDDIQLGGVTCELGRAQC